MIDDLRHFIDPFRSPGPDRGTDIKQHPDTDASGIGGQALIELLVIDQDKQIRWCILDIGFQPVEFGPDQPVFGQHLGKAHHREPCHVDKHVHPGLAHVLAAHAAKAEAGIELFQLADQACGVGVTGRFAGNDHYRFWPAIHCVCVHGCFKIAVIVSMVKQSGYGCSDMRLLRYARNDELFSGIIP